MVCQNCNNLGYIISVTPAGVDYHHPCPSCRIEISLVDAESAAVTIINSPASSEYIARLAELLQIERDNG